MNTLLAASRSAHVTVPVPRTRSPGRWWLGLGVLACLTSSSLLAQTTIYSENWDSYTSYAATGTNDTTYAFPTAAQPALVLVGNNPKGGVAGSGVQLINWLHHSGTQSLLIRSGCEADVNLYNTHSGTSYQLDFWLYMHKHGPTGTMGTYNWYIRPGGEGVDNNAGDDYIAYRGDRAKTLKVFNYNFVTQAWADTGKTTVEDTWQHHRLVVDANARTVKIYIDDMNTAYSSYLARADVALPTLLRLQHEGTTADDGYYAIDDITLTVNNAISLDTPFTDGFESYSVGASTNISGPWVTVACNGQGNNKEALNPTKVQVVDSSTMAPLAPHSGSKCLALQGGERGGVALAWGLPPKQDVKITWWANVPQAYFAGATDLKMNMALYNTINGATYGSSCTAAELAYGIFRQGSQNVGGANALLLGATAGGNTWADTGLTFVNDTWEEYQLTTYNAVGCYTIVKNPSSANPVIVATNVTFLTAGNSGPTFMASWASATNVTGITYIDDIRVESLTNAPYGPPGPQPSGPYAAAVLSNNPTAYYSCQDVAGSFVLWDTSAAGGHNGRWGSDTAKLYPKLGQAGIGGNAVLFHTYSGSSGNACAIAGNYADLNPAGPFAVEAWVKPITAGSSSRSPLASFAGVNGWLIYQWPQGNGLFQWVWVQQNGNIWISSGLSSPNQWYHLAATFDGTYVSFYVNGQYQGQADSRASVPNTSNPLTIGASSASNGNAFDGYVCQVALYSHAVAASDLLYHYQVGSTNVQNLPTAPSVLINPTSVSAYAGNPVSFQVVAQGYNPLSYQWYRNSTPIQGATSDTLTLVSDLYLDSGASFSAVVTNLYGSAPSSAATLTLATDLILSNSPVSITRKVGSKAAFMAVAGGAAPVSYQWYKGSSPIPTGTSQTLWLDNVQLSDDGSTYYVHVSNPYGPTTDTAPVTLSVIARTNIVPMTGYAAVVAAADPVGYWRLDQPDTNSPAVDAVGSFDGTYVATNGQVLTFGMPTGIPGETNRAVAVTNNLAINGRVIVPYALELNPAGPFAVEAWLQPNSQASNSQDWRSPFASLGTGGPAGGWNFYHGPDDLWHVLLWGNGLNYSLIDTNHAIIANHWYHVVFNYDGTNFTLYVNGALGASGAWSGFARNSNSTVCFGRRNDTSWNPFSGTIDDVAFYNKALTPAQIQIHYQNGLRVSITKVGNKAVLSWPTGTLQQSDTVKGTYTDLPSATSPYTNSAAGVKFFRVKASSL